MKIYVIQDKDVGYQILYNETQSFSCIEFTELCNVITKQYGKDLFMLKEELINRGFKVATIECIYSISKN